MRVILDAKEIKSCVERMGDEILKKGTKELVLVGIRTRGVYIAKRLAKYIKAKTNKEIPTGILDITFYRDDVNSIERQPLAKETYLPPITKKRVILVDDVLFTSRSVRAAIDELMDFGRPKCIELCVLIDRGHRELPFQPNYTGKVVRTSRSEKVEVHLREVDKDEKVIIKR